MPDTISNFRLGCKQHDPARAAMLAPAPYIMAPPPLRIPRPPWQPRMWGNDTLPDCTACATGHALRAWSWKYGGTDVEIPDNAVSALYAAGIGMPGATPEQLAATDGADPLDVVDVAQARGWNIGGQVPMVPDFRVSSGKFNQIAHTIDKAGSAMLALTLYEVDMEAVRNGQPWALPDDLSADRGAVVGGHMVAAAAYDGLGPMFPVSIATWGRWQEATWEWIMSRLRLVLVTGWRQTDGAGVNYSAVWAETA